MPYKDKERQLAYQREWYANHRQRVISKVLKRKRGAYAGTCLNCGEPTGGWKGPNSASEFCGKPECRSVQVRVSLGQMDKPKRKGKK